jgi:hypothetical protein
MQVTEAWIAIKISHDVVVMAYGPFDTKSGVMTFASEYNSNPDADGDMVVRKLRKPPSAPYWSLFDERGNRRRWLKRDEN